MIPEVKGKVKKKKYTYTAIVEKVMAEKENENIVN
jgi:hypothetical protein